MTIYIDTLIFTNIIIDYLLLTLTAKILKINFKYYRLILGTVLGGFTSLIILLPEINIILNFIIRIAVSFLIILVSFSYKSITALLKRTFTLFLITTGFSGIILFLLNIFKSNFIAVNNGTVYFNISPILLIAFTTIAYVILSLIDRIKTEKTNLIHKITFLYNNNRYTFLSKYDTCCNIKEPFSGDEVILAENSLIKGLDIKDCNYRLIPFNSIGGHGMIRGFLPDELYIDNEKINRRVYIGITENILKGEINSIFNYKNICE